MVYQDSVESASTTVRWRTASGPEAPASVALSREVWTQLCTGYATRDSLIIFTESRPRSNLGPGSWMYVLDALLQCSRALEDVVQISSDRLRQPCALGKRICHRRVMRAAVRIEMRQHSCAIMQIVQPAKQRRQRVT